MQAESLSRKRKRRFVIRAIDSGIVPFKILNSFILPIARSTWIRRDAIFLPFSISAGDSCFLPSRKGGIFRPIFISFNKSFIVNPLSAIIEMPGLSFSLVSRPHMRVSSTSEIDPT